MNGKVWVDIFALVATCGVGAAILYWNGWKEKRITKLSIAFYLVTGILYFPSLFLNQGFGLAMSVVAVATCLGSGCLQMIRYRKGKAKTLAQAELTSAEH